MKKRKFVAALFLVLSLGSAPLLTYAEEFPTNAGSPQASTMSFISTYKDDISYVYKIVNRKLYRRLYNYTTGQWIGDWELVP